MYTDDRQCYECVLCPVRSDIDEEEVEKAKDKEKEKVTTKKGKEKDREKSVQTGSERDERRMKDADKHKPREPREALKPTANNNWVHVTCAVWAPEIRFGDARALCPVEFIPLIPPTRYQQVCVICNTANGACVACQHCHNTGKYDP